jgi:alkylation response protein AidB-like acyl-CoA dehydrogenase
MTPDSLRLTLDHSLQQHLLPLPIGDLHAAALRLLECDAVVEATQRRLITTDTQQAAAKAAYDLAVAHLLTEVRAYRQAIYAATDALDQRADADAPGYVVKTADRELYLTETDTVTGRHWTWTSEVPLAQIFASEAEALAAVRAVELHPSEVEILRDPMAVDPGATS